MECTRCKSWPGFHSFEAIAEIKGKTFYYCYPAHNRQSVKNREDMLNFASHFPQQGDWSLIFHANGYGLSNMMPLTVALELGRIVQDNHGSRLHRIYIVEGSWFMRFLVSAILPFLRSDMREKFVLVSGSLIEVVAFFRDQNLSLPQLSDLRSNFGKFEG